MLNEIQIFLVPLVLLISVKSSKLIAAEDLKKETGLIGIDITLDYWSSNIVRGVYFYDGGAFFPSITYNILKSGLSLTVAEEISDKYLLDRESPKETRDMQATDFGLDYFNAFGRVELGTGIWYFRTWNNDNSFSLHNSSGQGFL